MSDFELDPRLAANHHIVDWPLCSIYLENDTRYPWLVLVPRRADLRDDLVTPATIEPDRI